MSKAKAKRRRKPRKDPPQRTCSSCGLVARYMVRIWGHRSQTIITEDDWCGDRTCALNIADAQSEVL